MEYAFGSGVLYGRSNTANSTPVRFGGLQGVTLDFSYSLKELYGQYQYPIALGRGTAKITGKADWAQFNAQAFNDLFFGQTSVATGSVVTEVAEAKTISANIVTATYNGAGNFVADMGVVLASDGSPFVKTGNTPVGQQYSCNETTGVYTFNATQNGLAVLISYTRNDASTGKKITMTNQLLGNAPQFMVVLSETFNSKRLNIVLNACMSSKLTLATKLEDFVIPSFDFQAFSDASNNIGTWSLDE